MKFKYTARTKEGELQAGFVEAPTGEVVSDILNSHELFVLSIESADKRKFIDELFRFLNRVKSSDLMVFTRQLSVMLESSVPLSDSLRNLYQQTRNPILKEAVHEIFSDIKAGLSFSQALERQGGIFSDFYVNMTRAAEITGQLESAMKFLADHLERENTWHSRIKNAMIYPAFVLVLFIIVAVIILTVVFPKLIGIFEENEVKLPLMTKIFLNLGNFIVQWWWLIIAAMVVLAVLLANYLRTKEGKAVLNDIMIRLPLFGGLLKKMYVARMAESVSVLIKGGIPITQALKVTAYNIDNLIYRDLLYEISDQVKAGETLSSLLARNENYFPMLSSQMVAIGETTGRLDELLLKVSALYTREANDVIDHLTELIQPTLILVIGVFVGLLFAAILLPIYNLIEQIKI